MDTAEPYTPPARPWSVPKCCTPCRIEDRWEQVQAHIDNMPPELWRLFIERMYTPLLVRLAGIDPKRRLTVAWVTALPPRRPTKSLKRLFFDACAQAQRNPSVEGTAARPVILRMYEYTLGILAFIDTFTPICPSVYHNLRAQILMLNADFPMLVHFSRCIRDCPFAINPAAFARETVRSGVDAYMLETIDRALSDRGIRPTIERRARRYDVAGQRMAAMRSEIIARVANIHDRRLAVAMALHTRLGQGSALGRMPEELLCRCVRGLAPELVRWDEITGPWMAEGTQF